VLFNLARAPDTTSWLQAMPSGVATAAHLLLAAAILATAIHVWRHTPAFGARLAVAAMLGIAAILAGPGAHHNYQLWWLPFYALLLSLAMAPTDACQDRRVGYTSAAEIAAKDA
jgi:hypothetical protein